MLWIAIVFVTDAAHRRNVAEALAKTLHTATFVIDSDQQCRTSQCPDFRDEVCDLRRRFVVSSKQDHAANARFAQQIAIGRDQRNAVYVEHHRTK